MTNPPFGLRAVTLHDPDALEAARAEVARRERAAADAPDGELVAFAAGLKPLLKRERLTREGAAALAAGPWLEGSTVEVFDGGRPGDVTLLASRDAALVRHALSHEQAERRSGGHRQAAIAALGQALGYPECCVRAFAARAVHDDATVLDRLLPAGAWTPLPWPANPLVPGLSLVTHYPCRPDCPATTALGLAVLQHLRARDPARADLARRVLAAPLVLFDRFRMVALEGAEADGAGVTYTRAWLPLEGSPEPACATTTAARLFLARLAPLFVAADRVEASPGRLSLSRQGRPVATLELAGSTPPWTARPVDAA